MMAWQRVDDRSNAVVQAGVLEAFATKMRGEIKKAREAGGPAHSDDYIAGMETAAAQAEWDADELRRQADRDVPAAGEDS